MPRKSHRRHDGGRRRRFVPADVRRDLDPLDDTYWQWHRCCPCRNGDPGGWCCAPGRCPPADVYSRMLEESNDPAQ